MYLLNTLSLTHHRFLGDNVPPYAILSHTWGDEEVLFQDIAKLISEFQHLKGFSKIAKCCALARSDGWEYVWIDNCCIDQKSSAELSEAINSMYRWYRDAGVCYAYLADISVSVKYVGTKLRESRWFTRGWTLQELLAPEFVTFYDQDWVDVGTKRSLQHLISDVTGIDTDHLFQPRHASVAAKMSWASFRETTRPEDIAYCLLGLFDVSMPLLYGEGASKAFERLQHEIIRSGDDESIFAWLTESLHFQPVGLQYGGMLAPSPEYFSRSGDIVRIELPDSYGPRVTLGGFGVSMKLSFKTILEYNDRVHELMKAGYRDERTGHAIYVAPLACANKRCESSPLKLHLQQLTPRTIARLQPREFDYMTEQSLGHLDTRTFHVNYRFDSEERPESVRLAYRSAVLTFRLSSEAQKRLSIRGINGNEYGWLDSRMGDDGRLTVEAAKSAIVNFEHARGFMVGFGSNSPKGLFVSIRKEVFAAGHRESISVPLDDNEVLWISSNRVRDLNRVLEIDDVDITFKDKVDRESIL